MTLWERFIQERVYLKGVSPATVRYHRWVERRFRPILDSPTATVNRAPVRTDLDACGSNSMRNAASTIVLQNNVGQASACAGLQSRCLVEP